MFVFRKIWRALFSCNALFKIRPFDLLPTNYQIIWDVLISILAKTKTFERFTVSHHTTSAISHHR